MTIKEIIEKAIEKKLSGFPDSDFERIEKEVYKYGVTEVWLMRGMGRNYIIPISKENTYSFPIREKLCTIALNQKGETTIDIIN